MQKYNPFSGLPQLYPQLPEFIFEDATIQDFRPGITYHYAGEADILFDYDTLPYPTPTPVQNFNFINGSAYTVTFNSDGGNITYVLLPGQMLIDVLVVDNGAWQLAPSQYVDNIYTLQLVTNKGAETTDAIIVKNNPNNYRTRYSIIGQQIQRDDLGYGVNYSYNRIAKLQNGGLQSFEIMLPDISGNAPSSAIQVGFRPNLGGTVAFLSDVEGKNNKDAVHVATTADIALSGLQTIDGYPVLAGDRVLVKNQAAPAENGIYVASVGAWARSADANSGSELDFATVFVQEGTTQATTQWTCNQTGIVIGTTPVAFIQTGGAGYYQAGSGLLLSGNIFSISPAYTASKQDASVNLAAISALTDSTGWLKNDGAGGFSYSTPTKSDVGLGNVDNVGTPVTTPFTPVLVDIGSPVGSSTIYTQAVSAGTLNADGGKLWVECFGTFAANSNSKTITLRLNGVTLFTTGSLAFNNASFRADIYITRVNNTTVRVSTAWQSSSSVMLSSCGYVEITGLNLASNSYNFTIQTNSSAVNNIVFRGISYRKFV